MKHLPFVLVLMSLVACGGEKSSKPNEEKFVKGLNCLQTPGALCIPKIRWNINTTKTGFPVKFSLSLNGAIIFDQCNENREDEVSTSLPGDPDRVTKSFKLDGAIRMKQLMKLEILDLGEDCRNNAIFYTADEVVIEPLAHAEADDWFVSQSVSVTLEN